MKQNFLLLGKSNEKLTRRYLPIVFSLLLLSLSIQSKLIFSQATGIKLDKANYNPGSTNAVNPDNKKVDQDAIKAFVKQSSDKIWFEVNKGQYPTEVKYAFKTSFGFMAVYKDKLRLFAIQKIEATDPDFKVGESNKGVQSVDINFPGASNNWNITPSRKSTTKGSYVVSTGRSISPEMYGEITLNNVYPGIDLRLYASENKMLEFDWVLKNADDYSKIRMNMEGQKGLTVKEDGSLVINLLHQDLDFLIPQSYQVVNGQKQEVKATATFAENSHTIKYTFDENLISGEPLVIDPTFSWSTFFDANSSSFDNYAYAVSANLNGVYVTGVTNILPAQSYMSNVAAGAFNTLGSGFITYRLNLTGTAITAWTMSNASLSNTNFSSTFVGDNDLFPDGRLGILYSNGDFEIFSANLATEIYFNASPGGVNFNAGSAIVVETDSTFYLGGNVTSAVAGISIGPDATISGTEGFICRYHISGSSVSADWGTYVGSDGNEGLMFLSLTPDKTKLVFGIQTNSGANAPALVNAVDATFGGAGTSEALVGVLPSQTAKPAAFNVLSWLGGSGNETFPFVTSTNSYFFVGFQTTSTDLPNTTGAFQTSNGGASGTSDIGIARIPLNGSLGSGFICSYLGGTDNTYLAGIVYNDRDDELALFGSSENGSFPTVNTSPASSVYQSSNASTGGSTLDMVYAVVSPDLTTKKYATFIGGAFNDYFGSTGTIRGQGTFNFSPITGSIYAATTTHSDATGAGSLPSAFFSGIPGFDKTRTSPASNSDDTHLIFSLNTNTYDHGDAPASYELGNPAKEAVDGSTIRLGATIDAENVAQTSALANGDDILNSGSADDEDGIAEPVFFDATASSFTLPVSVFNHTGSAVTLFGWIDLNKNGTFEVSEAASVSVPNNVSQQSVNLNWSGFSVTTGQSFLRLRISTSALTASSVSGTGATGEIEDYPLYFCNTTANAGSDKSLCTSTVTLDGSSNTAGVNYSWTTIGGHFVSGQLTASPVVDAAGTYILTVTHPVTGCTAKDTAIVTVSHVPPVITCPANVTINCQDPSDPANTGSATATDTYDPNPVISHTDTTTSGNCPGNYSIARTWKATDACNNISTCVQIITVHDITAPVITCPANVIVNCQDPTDAGHTGSATATDNCDQNPVISHSDITTAGNCAGNYTIARTWTATDNCGNSSNCTQTITVHDVTAPIITCPANVIVNCQDSTDPSNTGTASATDNCGTPTVTFSDATTPGKCLGFYVINRTWTATDACSNSASCTQIITVHDITAPVITCPADVTLNCQDPSDPGHTGTATATDNCDQDPSITHNDVTTPGNCPGNYSIARTWTATDNCSNASSCTQTITVHDVTAPVITCPADVTLNCQDPSDPGHTGTATATDNCDQDPSITHNDVTTPGNCPGNYTIARTWTATDNCSNASSCIQTITVHDVTAPVITCPADVTLNCQDPSDPGHTGTATATDNCDQDPSITHNDVTTPGNCPGNYSIARTWTATDNCSNASSCTQTITVHDVTAPVITCPADVTLNCQDPSDPGHTGTATATDNCDQDPSITHNDVTTPGNCPGNYTIARTWTATDNCSNASSCTQTITVHDVTAPVITCPADVTLNCQDPSDPGHTGTATATDNCDQDPSITHNDVTTPGNCPGNYTIARTWTATDNCSNASSCIQTITVHDVTAPVITCPADVTLNCQDPSDPGHTGTATATDNCDQDPSITHNDVTTPGNCPGNFTIARTWTATDNCSNASSCIQTITVHDVTAPVITCPADVTLNCQDPSDPGHTGTATATDNCDQDPSITHNDVTTPGNCPGNFTIARTWTATDNCSNASSCIQTITVHDVTAPVITCPVDVIITSVDSNDPSHTGSATATDNCDQDPSISHSDITNPGNCPGNYVITRTWTATDNCGNASSCVQTITSNDGTPPEITCPSDITINCQDSSDPSNTGSATATDDSGEQPLITHSDVITPGNCPGNYIITRTWTAADACGNASNCIQTITVHDVTAPVITCPADVTLNCQDPSDPGHTGTATATDNCDQDPSITHNDVTTPGNCPGNYTIARTWTATDNCSNASSCTQTITVHDVTAPVITCPADVTLNCQDPSDPGHTGTATATDNCDQDPSITHNDVTTPGNCPGNFTIARTWTATDNCSNASSCIQTITVHDVTAPVITCPVDVIITSVDSNDPSHTGSATATDNCDQDPSISHSDITNPGNCPGNYVITRTWTATDNCGNASSCVQTITSNDGTPPEITCPSDITINCQDSSDPSNTGSATATDDSGEQPLITHSDVITPGNCPGNYIITRTWTAADACGNASNCIQTITVHDVTPPSIGQPGADATINCPASPHFTIPTATDLCDLNPSVIEVSDVTTPGNCTGTYSRTKTWKAIDACGNESGTVSQTITVHDVTPPSISPAGADATINCPSSPQFTAPTATDLCDQDPSVIEVSDITTPGNCSGTYSRTKIWKAVDACGNESGTVSQTITVHDVTPPSIGQPGASITINCGIQPIFTAPTAIDGCDQNPQVIEVSDITTPGNCAGTYSRTKTWKAVDACGNQSNHVSQTIIVIDNTPPSILCSANRTLNCYVTPNNVVFDAPTALDECDANPSIHVVSTTTVTNPDGSVDYTRTWEATDACGNASRCSQTITVPKLYTPTITPSGSTSICSGASVELCAPVGNSYSWSPGGATSQCIQASATGSYSVDVTNASGCHGIASISVSVVPCLSCLITGDTTICQGETTQLCAVAGFSHYRWSNGCTSRCITVTCGGNYCVTVTDASGFVSQCCVHVTVLPLPSCCISGNTRICLGQSTTLCAPAGYAGYSWSTGATTRCITVSSAGTYSVTVTNINGCTSTCSACVTISAGITCSISGCTSICQGQSTSLCAPSGCASYLWNTGSHSRCITINSAGTYSVTITNSNGCISTCSVTVNVSSPPSCTISGNNSICQGQSTTLCAPIGGSSYHWNTGATSRCITVNCAGTYSVTVTNSNGCSSTCSLCVTIASAPNSSISGNHSICQGQSTSLCAPNGGSGYLWNNGATSRCITVTSAGTYSVTVTNAGGCSSTSSVCVTTSSAPNCTISGNSSICSGQSTSLCAPSGCSGYLWNTGATTRCITVTDAGTYSVTVTNSSGCSSTCSKTVSVSNPVTSTITGDNHICQGQTTSLCAPAGGSDYHWNTGATTQCISVNCAGTFSVTVTNTGGCSSTSSICVTISSSPNSTISGSNSICSGGSTTLCAPTGNSSYLWNTGATSRCISTNSAGTYSVSVTNSGGCSGTSSICVTTSTPPSCTITGNNSICTGQSTSLCAPAGCSSYRWNNGATTRCITATCAGTYSVTVTNSGGCSSTCSICVTTSSSPNSTISGNTSICQGQSTSLCAPAGAASYHWNTGATTRCITASCAGTYSVTVSNAGGCSSSSSVCITSASLSCNIFGNTSFCTGSFTTLCAPSGYTYRWNTGACTQSINVTCSGTYSVTITNANGCASTCSVCVNSYNCHGSGCGSKSASITDSNGSLESIAYPNPFKSVTTIQFQNNGVKTKAIVEIYGIDGAKIAEIYNNVVEENELYKVDWNAEGLSNGLYMYRIICGDKIVTGRLLLDR